MGALFEGECLPLLFKLHEIWSVDSEENNQNYCHQILDFEVKMHQIRFLLGLCPRPRWGSLQRSSSPLAAFKGPTSKGRRGGDRKEREGRGKERRVRGGRRGGEGK